MLDIAIVEGVRTPFAKAFGPLATVADPAEVPAAAFPADFGHSARPDRSGLRPHHGKDRRDPGERVWHFPAGARRVRPGEPPPGQRRAEARRTRRRNRLGPDGGG